MRNTSRVVLALMLIACTLLQSACAPEVGSERWCKAMDARDKGEWSANDVAAYAKHCVLGLKPAD